MTKKKHRTLQLVASILSNRISRFAGYFFHIRDRTVRHDRDVVNRQQKVYIGRFFPKESKVQVSSSHCLSRPMAPPPFYLYCNKRQGKKRWKNDLLRLLLSLQRNHCDEWPGKHGWKSYSFGKSNVSGYMRSAI